MRESFGGTMLLYIVVIFLFVYIAFMAFIFKYGRVFRAKNSLLSLIEANEGMNELSCGEVGEFLRSRGYYAIKGFEIRVSGDGPFYYYVTLFMEINFPLVGELAPIPIKGETSAIKLLADNKNLPQNVNSDGIICRSN